MKNRSALVCVSCAQVTPSRHKDICQQWQQASPTTRSPLIRRPTTRRASRLTVSSGNRQRCRVPGRYSCSWGQTATRCPAGEAPPADGPPRGRGWTPWPTVPTGRTEIEAGCTLCYCSPHPAEHDREVSAHSTDVGQSSRIFHGHQGGEVVVGEELLPKIPLIIPTNRLLLTVRIDIPGRPRG